MLEIETVSEPFDAVVKAPASKSYTNRALLIAALSSGKTTILNPLESDDTQYMAKALECLGIDVEKEDDSYVVYGRGGKLEASDACIFLGNSGTCMRFLATVCALVDRGHTILKGDERMSERPIADLIDALKALGVKAHSIKGNGCPPILVEAGGIMGGTAKIKGDKSSQYFTSILLSAPYAKKDVTIETLGELTSKPYIDMTIASMREFGVNVENNNYKKLKVKAGQIYRARDYNVEGDYSNASYLFAAAAVTGSKIRVTGINPDSAQGDRGFVELLVKMGCKKSAGKDWIEITGPKSLKAITEIDMNNMPDVSMTLAVVAAFAEGITKIVNVANLRIKETDRIKATVNELRRVGIMATELDDGMIIQGGKPHGAIVETYNDHRIAMCFSVIGLVTEGIVLKDETCVSKTYPTFFEDMRYVMSQVKSD